MFPRHRKKNAAAGQIARRLLVAVGVASAGAVLFAAGPAWWQTRGVLESSPATNDYAVCTVGQLKWIATQAALEFEAKIPGGTGTGIAALVSSFSATNNYYPVTIGQAKAVAQTFHDRLMELGVTTNYPWTSTVEDDRNFAPANIGQIKELFAFDPDALLAGAAPVITVRRPAHNQIVWVMP